MCLSLSLLAGEVPGSLKGDFQFSKSGQAGFAISLDTPPGRKGLQPSLSLSYNSAGGNGSVGIGWSFSTTLSTISRVGQINDLDGQRTMVELPQDGNFDNDRLALDGNRLMLVSGQYGADKSVYHTRIETLQKVTLIDENPDLPGPERFEVRTKDGFVRVYGAFVHHRVQRAWNKTALKWLLSSITDPHGNTMTVDYMRCPDPSNPSCGSGLEYLPTVLKYEGRTIHLNYEVRPDQSSTYRAGLQFSQTQRLTSVDVFVNSDGDSNLTEPSDFAYSYELTYAATTNDVNQQSKLVGVTMVDANGDQYPATTFDWLGENDQVGFIDFAPYADASLPLFAKVKQWANQPFSGKYNEGTHLIDLNGDGLKDLVQGVYRGESSQGNDETTERRIFLNRITSWEELSATHPYIATWETLGTSALFSARSNMNGNHPGGDLGTRFADLNGDSMPDLIQLVDGRKAGDETLSKPQTTPQILLNMGEDEGWQVIDASHPWLRDIPKHPSGDPDIYFSKLYRAQVYHQSSANGGTQLADLNGDGRSDLFQWIKDNGVNKYRVYLNKGPDAQTGGWEITNAYHTSITNLINNPNWNNRSFFAEDVFASGNQSSWRSDTGLRLSDINGDGFSDLIHLNRGKGSYPEIRQVALNRGPQQGFVYDTEYSASLPTDADGPFFVECIDGSNDVKSLGTRMFDVNGDGLNDLLRLYQFEANTPVKSLYLNTGKGFVAADWTLPGNDALFTFVEGYARDGGTRMADFNNDGLVDLMVLFYDANGNDRRNLYLQEQSATRSGWFPINQSGTARHGLTGIPTDLYFAGRAGNETFDTGTRIDDVNGDGRLDLFQLTHVDGLYTKRRCLLGMYKQSLLLNDETVYQTAVNRVETIRNGLGAKWQFEYHPLSVGGDLYSRGSGAQYPYRDITPKRQMLSASHRIQPMGGDATSQVATVSYRYHGFRTKLDIPNGGQPGLDGGGSLGFATITQVNQARNLLVKSEYDHQNYPYYGKTLKVTQCTLDEPSVMIGQETYEYITRNDTPTANGQTYFLRQFAVDRKTFEGGNFVFTTRVATDYDAFGHPLRERHYGDRNSPDDNTFIHMRYWNQLSDWRIGVPNIKVHSSSSNYSHTQYYTHKMDLDYDNQYRMIRQTVVNLEGGDDVVNRFEYDSYGNVVRQIGPEGLVTERTFDTIFNFFPTELASDPTGVNHVISLETEPVFGQTLRTINPNGVATAIRIDGFGRKKRDIIEDPITGEDRVLEKNDLYWANQSTKEGLRIVVSHPKSWDEHINSSYLANTGWVDTWGRVYRKRKSGSGTTQQINIYTRYNDQGQVAAKSLPSDDTTFYWETYNYDVKGRQTELAYPVENPGDPQEVETYHYGMVIRDGLKLKAMTHKSRHIRGSQDAKQTVVLTDARDRTLERRFQLDDGSESVMFYKYDALDRIVQAFSQANVNGERVRFRTQYDSLNRKLWNYEEVVVPDGGGWQVLERIEDHYNHDLNGQITSMVDANGNRIDYTYDVLGRKVREQVFPTNTPSTTYLSDIHFTYDVGAYSAGQLTQVEGLDNTAAQLFQYNWTFDKYGQVAHETTRYAGLDPLVQAYSYRMDGLPLETQLPDGSTMRRGYNGLNQPAFVALDEPMQPNRIHVAWEDYNAAGSPGRVVYGNGVVTEYEHEPHSARLAAMSTYDSSNGIIADKAYLWNSNGQIDEILDDVNPNQDQQFTYDLQNRLIAADGVYGFREYLYDDAGNMLEKGDKSFSNIFGFRLEGGYDAASGRNLSYDYDANGNQVGRNIAGVDEFFEFDPFDRMMNYYRQDPDGQIIQNNYRYDHSGRRYMKQDSDGGVTYYISPAFEIFKKGNLEQVTKYVYGSAGKMAQVTMLMGPDLVATIRGTEVIDYNRYELEVKVSNIGDRPSGQSALLVLRTDLDYVEATVNSLPPGGNTRFFLEVEGSAKATTMAHVDADFQIEEKDEENNLYVYQIPLGPDLIVADAEVVANSSSEATIVMTIENIGKAPTAPATFKVYGPGLDKAYEIGRLLPDGKVMLESRINLPGDWSRPTYTMVIDDDNRVAETNENNNQITAVLYVPDYTVSDFRILPGKTKGQVSYELHVNNVGDGGPDRVQLRLQNVTSGAVETLEVQIPKAGSAWQAGVLNGSVSDTYRATVNPNQTIYESNFNNNSALGSSIVGSDDSKSFSDD